MPVSDAMIDRLQSAQEKVTLIVDGVIVEGVPLTVHQAAQALGVPDTALESDDWIYLRDAKIGGSSRIAVFRASRKSISGLGGLKPEPGKVTIGPSPW